MVEAMRKYLQMGTVHFMSFPDVLADESQVLPTLKQLIADPYFSVLEVAHIKDEAIRAEAAQLLRGCDCTLIFAAQPEQLGPKLSINTTDAAERRRVIDLLKARIDEAYDMDAEGFGFIAGPVQPGKEAEQLTLLADACKELCAHAKQRGGMPLELEQFDFDVHNKLLCGPALSARHVYDDVVAAGYDNFGILVDLSHLPLVRETPAQCLGILKEAVTHVHIGNAVYDEPASHLYGDFHPRFSMPGSVVDTAAVTDFLRELFHIGFFAEGKRPIVSFEIKAWPPDDPNAVLAECKRTLDLAWAML